MGLPLLASLLPAGLGLLGNIFGGKGKKTEYNTMEPPWMQQMRQQAMQQMMRMSQTGPAGMGPTQQAYQNLMQRFYPGQAQGMQGGMPGGGMPGGMPQMGGGMPQMGGGMPQMMGGMPQMGGGMPQFPQQQGPSSIPMMLGQYAQRYPGA